MKILFRVHVRVRKCQVCIHFPYRYSSKGFPTCTGRPWPNAAQECPHYKCIKSITKLKRL